MVANRDTRPPAGDGILTGNEVDRLTAATAAGSSMNSRQFCDEDLGYVLGWARLARNNSQTLDLVLAGQLLPVGIRRGGVVVVGVEVVLTSAEAAEYRAELERVMAGWELPFPLKFKLSIDGDDGDLDLVLGDQEKAAVRLARQTGRRPPTCADLNDDQLLRWAAECRNDGILLSSVLVGDVLPIPRTGKSRPEFRGIEDLSKERKREYRAALQRIGAFRRP